MTIEFAYEESPLASIVVSGWKSAPQLERCLSRIASNVRNVSYEVIVSLSAASADVEGRLGSVVKGAKVLATSTNIGFAAVCNRGVAAARGKYVILLNDDTEVEVGWLEALITAAVEHPEAGAIGSLILLPDGSLQESGVTIWSDGSVDLAGYQGPRSSAPTEITRVDHCSAASLLVPRHLWQTIGGMDEGYFPAYYEDVDLCLKLEGRGFPIFVQPRSMVIHHGSALPFRYRDFLVHRNRERFVARWGPLLVGRPPAPEGDRNVAAREALDIATNRPLPPFTLPQVPDVRSTEDWERDGTFRRLEMTVLEDYVSAVEAQADSLGNQVPSLRASLSKAESDLHALRVQSDAKIAELQASSDHAVSEMLRIRGQAGYRLVDRTYAVLRRVPVFFQLARWMVRILHRVGGGTGGGNGRDASTTEGNG